MRMGVVGVGKWSNLSYTLQIGPVEITHGLDGISERTQDDS